METSPASPPERRGFLVKALAGGIGALAGLIPLLSGAVVFLDPLRRKSKQGELLKVANLDDLPPDGVPRAFQIIADRSDAWNFYPKEPVGAVYLRRTKEGETPEAVTAVCPHLGCFVDFNAGQNKYQCPCHDSSFTPDGKRINPETCPSARDLDSLRVEVKGTEVWVEYQKFRGGSAEKIPEA